MHRTHLRYTTLVVAAVGFISTWLADSPLLAQSPSMTRRVVQRDAAESQLQWSGRYGRSDEPDELKWTAPKSGPTTHRRVSHSQSTHRQASHRRVSAERSIVLNNAGAEEVEYIDAEPLPSPDHGSVYHPHNYGVGDCDCEGPHAHGHPQLVGSPSCCGGSCGGNCGKSCNDCCTIDCCTCMNDSCCDTSYCCREMSFFGGVQGFKGPVDLGQNGNFGFHGGVNVGMPLFERCGISTQLGARAVQTSLHGNSLEGPSGTRDQTFVTLGVFHRTYHGVQWGFAYDLMSDDYYVQSELTTMRAELSYVCPNGREVGFSGIFSGDDDNVSGIRTQFITDANGQVQGQRIPFTETWQPVNQYRLFFRQRLACGGYGRIFGGGTSEGDSLVGGDFLLPISQCFSLNSSAVYLIPEQGGQLGISEEAWNIGISLVWTPGRRTCDSCGRTRRITPLFDVADNGTFLVDRF